MFNIILFGAPGSGKGTQSEKIVSTYGLIHLSTGDLLRKEKAAKTPLGLEAESLMSKGILVPDEIVIGMISSAIDANPQAKGFLFDGFPRTVAQAEALDKLLKLKNSEINVVPSLKADDEVLIKRLTNRGLTSGRSDDQDPEVQRHRLTEYYNKTAPVANHYKHFNKVVDIDGEGTEEEVFALLAKEIEQRMNKVD